jgi:hypothetical protein
MSARHRRPPARPGRSGGTIRKKIDHPARCGGLGRPARPGRHKAPRHHHGHADDGRRAQRDHRATGRAEAVDTQCEQHRERQEQEGEPGLLGKFGTRRQRAALRRRCGCAAVDDRAQHEGGREPKVRVLPVAPDGGVHGRDRPAARTGSGHSVTAHTTRVGSERDRVRPWHQPPAGRQGAAEANGQQARAGPRRWRARRAGRRGVLANRSCVDGRCAHACRSSRARRGRRLSRRLGRRRYTHCRPAASSSWRATTACHPAPSPRAARLSCRHHSGARRVPDPRCVERAARVGAALDLVTTGGNKERCASTAQLDSRIRTRSSCCA